MKNAKQRPILYGYLKSNAWKYIWMMKKICRPTASFKEGWTVLTGTIVLSSHSRRKLKNQVWLILLATQLCQMQWDDASELIQKNYKLDLQAVHSWNSGVVKNVWYIIQFVISFFFRSTICIWKSFGYHSIRGVLGQFWFWWN